MEDTKPPTKSLPIVNPQAATAEAKASKNAQSNNKSERFIAPKKGKGTSWDSYSDSDGDEGLYGAYDDWEDYYDSVYF